MTTNNLIGYDPLAWMDGEVVDSEVIEDVAVEPVKKTPKSKAKVKPVEIPEEVTTEIETIEEASEASPVETEVIEPENEGLEASVEEVGETPEESVPEVEIVTEDIIEPLVELGTEASLKTLSALYETFKRVLAAHDVIEINASDVTTIDTATLQLLVSLKKDAPRLNKTITIIYPSERFIESAKLLDLLTILEITE